MNALAQRHAGGGLVGELRLVHRAHASRKRRDLARSVTGRFTKIIRDIIFSPFRDSIRLLFACKVIKYNCAVRKTN